MNLQRLFGNEDLQLLEFPEQGLFELSNEAAAPLAVEVQYGYHDHLIEVQATFALPDATEREVALLGGQAAEPSHEAPLDGVKQLAGKRLAVVVGEGEIEVVTAGRPSHDSGPPGGRRV